MTGYHIIPGDWVQLEQVINEIGANILDADVPLSTVLTSESDPVFLASDAAGITAADIARWNRMRIKELEKDTATTIIIGPLFNWADSKTLLSDALGGNDNFDPADLVITLFKGTASSVLSDVAKTGGTNNMNLVAAGMATLTLTAGDVDTAGSLTVVLTNATEGGEVVFPKSFDFFVVE
jgi:hypothetical protein